MICDVISSGDLEAYVCGEASSKAARAVEAHLFGCRACAAELRLLQSERRLFRARADVDTAVVPTFADVLARIDREDGGRPAPALPLPFLRGSRRGAVGIAMGVLALAAAVAGLWLSRQGAPVAPTTSAARSDEAVPEIFPDAVCEDPAPISSEPIASVEPEPAVERDRSVARMDVARMEEDSGLYAASTACGGDVCAWPEAPFTSAGNDAVAWCSGGRP